jgi:hypothetical protein
VLRPPLIAESLRGLEADIQLATYATSRMQYSQ